MSRIRFLHTADLHLGASFTRLYEKVPDSWTAILQRAADEVLARIVDVALEQHVDVVTIAGDLFDAPDPPVSAQYEALRQFKRLAKADVMVVLTHGNHDASMRAPLFAWPENVHVLAAPDNTTDVQDICLQIHSLNVQFSGFSYVSSELYGAQVAQFHRMPTIDVAVALYHGQVGPSSGRHAAYAAASVRQLAEQSSFDVWALGHLHGYAELHPQHPLILYPGAPQGRDSSETGAHGVALIDVEATKPCVATFVPTAGVEWTKISIDVSDSQGLEDVWQSIRAYYRGIVPSTPQVIHLHLHGYTPLHALYANPETGTVLQAAADDEGWPLWIHRYTTACQAELDWHVWEQSDGYVGALLRLLEQMDANAEDFIAEILTELDSPEAELVMQTLASGAEQKADVIMQTRQILLSAMNAEQPV
ncbi:metallophosphoesterase [Alicyclobacillus fodiniaquatilis]|uniref:Metallophosphoesterase n=1 Tax=Alicyclobacillus fodiniaquatilis TaxID=1661150 RepID=A0ABW4JMP1_9BACL